MSEIITILSGMSGIALILFGALKWTLGAEITAIGRDVHDLKETQVANEIKFASQTVRTDRLYEIAVELLRERREERK